LRLEVAPEDLLHSFNRIADPRSVDPFYGCIINLFVFSNLAHRPIRTILRVLAIAVEVTMILTLVGVGYGTLDSTARRACGVGADILIRPGNGGRATPDIKSVLRASYKSPRCFLFYLCEVEAESPGPGSSSNEM
jgi:hypothetical protein